MRAIGYARVSTTKQDLARQRDKITDFCTEKGYDLKFIIEDFGISGATLERKGYLQLNSFTENDCDVIIVSEISRLSRKEQITEALSDIQNILKRGISVILLDNPSKIYQANEDLKFDELIMLIFQLYGAAQERKDIKQKNQDGKQALFRSNPYAVVDGKIPFGFRKVKNTQSDRPKYLLEENPEEIAIVRKIFDMVLEGKTLYGIMTYLNERNIMINNGLPSVSMLSRIIHNKIYMGIRERKQSFGKEKGKESIATQYISPIISEQDFVRAGELIKQNNKFVATGKVHFNPLKGIIRCRCGRSMMIKDKKPQQGVSKLTYRCSCTESKNSPHYCTHNVDEVSYELTNSVVKSLFLQRSVEISEFYKKAGTVKIEEMNEVLNGLDKKIEVNRFQKNDIDKKSQTNIQKLLAATSPTFVKALETEQENIEQKEKDIEKKYAELNRKKREILNKIEAIRKAYSAVDVYQRMKDTSNDDLTELYHLYLERIEYYPITIMKGFYKIIFKTGMVFYIAITKVRYSPKAYFVDAEVNLTTGDITFSYIESKNLPMNNFTVPASKTQTVNIQDFFYSKWVDYGFATELKLDLSYREKYAQQLADADK